MKPVFYFYGFCGGLLIGAILLLRFWLSFSEGVRLIGSFVLILFLPGFVWSWVIWKLDEISEIQRITYALALSIVTVPFFLFVLNRLGLPINAGNSLVTTSVFIAIGFIIITLRVIRFNE